jgi:hypothetical protein
MAKSAINWGKYILLLVLMATVFFASPLIAHAVQYQQCPTDSSCQIGEFLYDDNYLPVATSACTYTSRYPNGDLLVNGSAMTGSADGWYSYSVGTSGLSNGVYRGQMCCVTDAETTCLDKSFEVSATLGSLVSDIWSSPNRSLTTFGTLISDIWGHSSAVGTSTSINAIGSSLAVISAQVSAVQTDVDTIDTKINSLQSSINTLQSDSTILIAKWGSSSISDVIGYVDGLETSLGNNAQTCLDNSVFGQIKCLQDKWGAESASSLQSSATNAYNTAVSLRSELNFNGKSTTAYDEIMAIKGYVDSLETSVGSSSDLSSASTIFGRVKQVKEAVDAIDNSTLDLNDLLAKWGSYDATTIYDKVVSLGSTIATLNSVSNVENITNNNITQNANLTDLQNQILALRALLSVNRTILEKIDNKPVIKTWLENGSIIFKNLITNPSATLTQTVPFVYYLPPEVKQEDIMKNSPEISVKYDTSKAQLYATGEIILKPKQTVIVEVEVEDIWSVPDEKIASLRKQSSELFAPLKKTAYFAQGASLNADIQASLDRIVAIQTPNKLPEDKIKDYQDAQIELTSVNRKMDTLKEIVTSAGSIGTLSGFIGGVQTMAVWGIVVVLVAGFVFLGLYIRSLSTSRQLINTPPMTTIPSRQKSSKSITSTIIIAIFFGTSFGTSSTLVYFYSGLSKEVQPQVLSATTTIQNTPTPTSITVSEPTISPEPSLMPSPTPTESTIEIYPTVTPTFVPTIAPLQKISPATVSTAKSRVVVPDFDTVYLYSRPANDSAIVYKITNTQIVDILVESKRWTKVILTKLNLEGWVSQDFIDKTSR